MSIQCSTMVMTKVRDILELPRRKNQGILGDWAQPGHSQWVACGMGILHYISPFFKVRRGHPGEARTWSCPRVFTKTGISFDNSKVSVCTSELVCNLHRLFPVKLPLLLSILIPNRHMRWVAMLTLPLVFAFGAPIWQSLEEMAMEREREIDLPDRLQPSRSWPDDTKQQWRDRMIIYLIYNIYIINQCTQT